MAGNYRGGKTIGSPLWTRDQRQVLDSMHVGNYALWLLSFIAGAVL
jgi:hypothetical protein